VKRNFTLVLMLLLIATGVAHAQNTACINYSLNYAVYDSETLSGVGYVGPTANPGTGTVTISGNERQKQGTCAQTQGYPVPHCIRYNILYDSGTVSIAVNGYTASVSYVSSSTAAGIASALATNLNGHSNILATVNGNVITIGAETSGAGTNYPLSVSSFSTNHNFSGTSFPISSSGSALSGGVDGPAVDHVLTSVITDGSASMTLTPGGQCQDAFYNQLVQQLPTATHTANSYNSINGVGAWGSGQTECVTCYLSYENDQDSGALEDGQEVPQTIEGQVICSIGGQIFTFTIGKYLEAAYIHSVQTGVRSNCFYRTLASGTTQYVCDLGLSNWCSYLTTPADVEVTLAKQVVLSPDDFSAGGYWNSEVLLGRFTEAAPYSIPVIGFGLASSDPLQLTCTCWNKDHGFGSSAQWP
jgi:hypothetical protein